MRDPIAAALTQAIGMHVYDDSRRIGGGSIYTAFAYRAERASLFVKVCALEHAAMIASEAAALRELATTRTIRVPDVLAIGKLEDRAFICLEWFELVEPTAIAQTRLGEQLAALHACTADAFGWHRDNFIGTTPQRNDRQTDWIDFYRTHRLEAQLELAAKNGADARTIDKGQRLAESVDVFFASYRPKPSLLHGDLWGGNWGAIGIAEPVIFDPASYYGDREADVAMTRLFGGFGEAFYAAYESTWPLDADAPSRVALYNLYHVLNHFNMFGSGYLSQARNMIEELLVQAGRR